MGDGSLLIGGHSDGCIPSCFVYPIQMSLKLLILISLTLDGHLGCGHAYLSWSDCLHPVGKDEWSGSSRSSEGCPISP